MTTFKVGEKVRVKFNRFNYEGRVLSYLGGCGRDYVVSFDVNFYIDSCKFSDNNLALSKLVFPEYCLNRVENKRVTFIYEKSNYDVARRSVEVQEESPDYICGLDVDDGYAFKKFLKTKIVGPIKEVK